MIEALNKCPACAAAIRPNAVFCHHCGRPLPPPAKVVVVQSSPTFENADLRANNSTIETQTAADLPAPQVEPSVVEPFAAAEPLEKAVVETSVVEPPVVFAAETDEVRAESPKIIDAPPVVNSAVPNVEPRKSKRYIRRTEYVWEAAETPAWRVLLIAVLALILVAVLFLASRSLR